MAEFKLSPAAELDVMNIAYFGMERFGIAQFEHCRDKLQARFEQLSKTPELYPKVDHIRVGYRRSVCGAHYIYYRINNDAVKNMRIIGNENF